MAEKTYKMPPKPEYHTDIRKLQRKDPGDAESVFNPLIQQLLENTHFVKLFAEALAVQNTADHDEIRQDVQDKIAGAVAAIPTPDVSKQISVHNAAADAHASLFQALKDQIKASVAGVAAAAHTHTLDQIGAAAAKHIHTKADISDFPTSLPASDVYGWAKSSKKPAYTASEVGAAAANHTHSPSEIGAAPASHTHSLSALGAAAASHTHSLSALGAAPASHSHTPSQVGAAPASHKHTKADISDFPTSLPASDVYSWAKQASKPAYTASEVGALPVGGTAAAATKLATARTVRTNLSSTSSAIFDGTSGITPGVTGILSVGNGGTGVSSLTGTDYTTYRPRGIALLSSVPSSLSNGQIALVYV